MADALQLLMEHRIAGLLPRARLRDLAEQVANQIRLTQDRNRRARISACKRRTRELAELGFPPGSQASVGKHAVSL